MLRFAILMLSASLVLVSAVDAETNYTALDLRSATQLALKHNPMISSAGAAADMNKAGVDKATSALRPTLDAEANYSYLSKETLFGNTPIMEHDTQANRIVAGQLIYSGGAVQAGIKQAKQGYAASNYGAEAVRADVLTNVSVAYFRARQAAEAIDVAQASEKALASGYDAAVKLHESGVVTNSDVLRAKVALTSAEAGVIAAKNNYEVAKAALRTAIGLDQNQQIDINPGATDAELNIAQEKVIRPEVAAGEAAVQAADAGKAAAKAARQPNVTLFADFYNQPVGAQFPRLTNTVMAGVMMKLNVFDGGLTRAKIAEADAASRKAREDLEAQKRQVELEQQTAEFNLNSAKARVETTATQVQSAEESLRSLEIGYREGISSLTDVLSAEAALTSARVTRLAALYDVKIAQISLLRAFGHTDELTK